MPSHNQGYPITIDGVASSTIPEFLCHDIEREMVGERRHEFLQVAGAEGAYLFPEQAGLRLVTLNCSVLADSFPADRRSAVRKVARWVEKFEWTKLIFGDEPDWFNLGILSEVPNTQEWRDIGRFELPFICQPYMMGVDIESDTEVSAGTSKTFNISVGGEVRTYPIITLTPAATATSVTITINGRTITRVGNITTAGKITYNGIARIIQTGVNVDTDVVGDFSGATLSMGGVTTFQVPWFDVGDNSITISMPGSSGWTADTVWRERA